jgi:arylsulfatase A-like enzyme
MMASVLGIAGLLAGCAHATAAAASSSKARRPNFLFILADDWGWGDVGAYGAAGDFTLTNTNTRTPTLDALARNGTLLSDFHAHCVCSPSRAAWLTGRFAEDLSFNGCIAVGRTGWQTNPKHGFPYQLPTPTGSEPSPWNGGLLNVGTLMQRNGWLTAHYGKWHVGGCSPPGNHTPSPSEYGFDRTATHASAIDAGCVPSTEKDIDLGHTNRALFPDPQWQSADVDDVVRDLSIAFMRNATEASKAFYVQAWLHMSHAKIEPRPSQYAGAYPYNLTCLLPRTASFAAANPGGSGTPGEPCDTQAYYGSQHWTDTERIRPLIEVVDSLGVRENTYIVFSTDNGPASAGIEGYGRPGPGGGGSMATGAAGVTGPFRGMFTE